VVKSISVAGERRARRRESILAAAVRVAERRGWLGFSMDEVAREARVAKGTLYLHFSGKGELIAAIAHHVCERLLVSLEDRPTAPSLAEVLRSWRSDPRIWPALPSVALCRGPDVDPAAHPLIPVLASLERRLNRGPAGSDTAALSAAHIVSILLVGHLLLDVCLGSFEGVDAVEALSRPLL
jgi:AcrR family transcriptional regulator